MNERQDTITFDSLIRAVRLLRTNGGGVLRRWLRFIFRKPRLAAPGRAGPTLHLERTRVPVVLSGWGWLRGSGESIRFFGEAKSFELLVPAGTTKAITIFNLWGSTRCHFVSSPTLREAPTVPRLDLPRLTELPKPAPMDHVHPVALQVPANDLRISLRPFDSNVRIEKLHLNLFGDDTHGH